MLRSTLLSIVAATCCIAVVGCERDAARVPTAEPPAAESATPLAARDPLPSWNDGAAKQAIEAFVARVTTDGGAGLRAAERAHRGVRQRRHAVVGAAAVLPARVRARSRTRACAGTSGVARAPAVQVRARRQHAGGAGRRRAGRLGADERHPRRQHDRGIRRDRSPLDRVGAASSLRSALHRARFPADARAARLLARQRLQDLHRVGRRRRFHAAVGRERLRHSSRASRR